VNRIVSLFAARKKPALVLYLTAGDPSFEETPGLIETIAEAGGDLIELGIPWSDPSADGPAIQKAMSRALDGRKNIVPSVLDTVQKARQHCEAPIVLFGYWNPILQRGVSWTAKEAKSAGADGFLVVDLPDEECAELDAECRKNDLCRIPLLAPTTPLDRAGRIAARGSGFAYYVSLTGTTGAASLDVSAVGSKVAALRPALGALPLAVGFGVRSAETARLIGRFADAVVVGSALVERIAAGKDAHDRRLKAAELVRELRHGLDNA
jgi:tryptophan synthase alpha chain